MLKKDHHKRILTLLNKMDAAVLLNSVSRAREQPYKSPKTNAIAYASNTMLKISSSENNY